MFGVEGAFQHVGVELACSLVDCMRPPDFT